MTEVGSEDAQAAHSEAEELLADLLEEQARQQAAQAAQKAKLVAKKAESAAKAETKKLDQLQKSHKDILAKLASPDCPADKRADLQAKAERVHAELEKLLRM